MSEFRPVPIQVVFQGGGAKLCVLMAVCEILKKYEEENRIVVRRVAGSSAGAIAAVMLASKKSMETYKAEVKSIGKTFLSEMRTNHLVGVWRILTGNAYYGRVSLESFFEKLICENGGPRSVADLRCDPQLYFTDLYSLRARVSPPEEPIPAALAKSCRFPFAFVGYKSGDVQVDGGLALNLPVDSLKRDESLKGNVIGIGFSSGFGEPKKGDLISYAQQLYSAAIENGVARSEAILGPNNVFRIATAIGTFDFELALAEGFDVHYQLVAGQFQTWLDTWLKSFGPIDIPPTATMLGKSYRLIRPPLTNTPLAPAVVRELDEREVSYHVKTASTHDVALFDGNGQFIDRYRSRNIMKFTISKPTNVMQFTFQTGKAATFSEIDLGCGAVNNQGVSLAFALHVQELPIPDDLLKTFRVYLFFENSLLPDDPHQPYIIDYQYEAIDPYPHLGKKPIYSALATRAFADEMIVAAAFPCNELTKNLRHYDLASRSKEQLKDLECDVSLDEITESQELPRTDFMHMLQLEHPPEKYVLFGRIVKNHPPKKHFGLVIG